MTEQESYERLKSDFLQWGHVALHDLGSSVAAVDQLVQWAEQDWHQSHDFEVMSDHLAMMNARLSRMAKQVKGLREYVSLVDQPKTLTTVDVQKVFDQIVTDLKETHPQLEILCPEVLPQLCGHDLWFKQILKQLLKNVADHGERDDPQVIVSFKKRFWCVELCFLDNGPGIDQKYHQKVWELFRILARAKRENHLGLGLALVKKIVDDTGGLAWVESPKEGGTAVKVLWPRYLWLPRVFQKFLLR